MAYIAFTSGTTGEPLAVQGTHAGLSAYLAWMPKQFKLHKKQRFSMLSGLGHDPLQREIFTALALGATLVIPTQAVVSAQLAPWVSAEQISVMHLTPSLAQILLVSQPAANTTLNQVFITGETLPVELAQQLCAYTAQGQVVNSYGSTETQRSVTYQTIEPAQLNSAQFAGASVAASSQDTKLVIRNPQQQRCGTLELGEIVLHSAYLAAGYAQDELTTKQKFQRFDNGISEYLTGDLARYLPDGSVQLCGRADQQLAIRGFRIDPLEVANALRELDGVSDAAAHVQPADSHQPAQLVGYVVSSTQRDSAELVAQLSKRLPSAMLPNQVICVSELPMTANNKLDIAALPTVEATPDEFVEPVGDTEIRLAKLWAECLAVNKPSATQTFGELGGNSILLTRIIHEVHQAFDVELSISDCVNNDTIRQQANIIGTGSSKQPTITAEMAEV
jgi:acyl-coenzyme A synthetase/AMP-(fatty) acid ligase